jgi:hypothetical protein
MRKLIKINTNKFRIGETYQQPVEQPVYQQEVKTPVDIQSILDKYNTKGQFTETSPEDHEILLNYILGEREREEIENGIKQQGGLISLKKEQVPIYSESTNRTSYVPAYNTPKYTEDSDFEDVLEFVDPTGLSSWDDVYRAIKDPSVSIPEAGLEAFGALPLIGKSGKVLKGAKSLAKELLTSPDFWKKTTKRGMPVGPILSPFPISVYAAPFIDRAKDAQEFFYKKNPRFIDNKQQGGKILDQNGYLLSNFLNFTPKKVIQGDANGTTITTNGMAFPILANGKKLFPNTGEYRFKESFVEEVPMYQKGGGVQPIIVNSKNDPRYRAYQDSLTLYKKNAFDDRYLPKMKHVSWSNDVYENQDFSTLQKRFSKEIPDFNNAYKRIKKLNNKEPNVIKTKLKVGFSNIPNMSIDTWSARYKKPVQPVIYEPNNTFEDNEGNIVSSGINKPTGKTQLVQMIKRNENIPQQLNPLSIINTREIPEQDSLKVAEPIDYNQNKLNLTKSLPLEEGTYFTRENQLQEIGGKRYVDKKTGKLIGEMNNGNFEYNPLWLEMNPDLKNEVAEFKKGGKTTREPNQFIPIMEQKEQQYGLPKGILKGVAQTESNFNPNAVSEKSGATGLMQFMPQTAKQYGIDPTDPIQSIDGSARMLKDLHKQFGNWDDALRAYNFGSGNVMKWKQGKKDLPKETREYVGKVYNNANLTSEVNSNYIGLANQKGVSKDGYEEYEDTYLEDDDEFVDIEEEMEFENKLDEALEEEEQQIAEMEDEEDEMMQQQEIEEEQFVSGQEIQNQMLELEQAERRDRVMSILNMFNS